MCGVRVPEFWIFLTVILAFVAAQLLRRYRMQRLAARAHATTVPANATDLQTNSQSPQDVCEHLAEALDANAIVVERVRDEIIVAAGAPWKTEIQALDKIALDWSFVTGLPPKSGGGNPFGTDWLFLPVQVEGRVAAVLGVMARHGRRRFIPDEQPSIHNALIALRRFYETRVRARTGYIYLRDSQILRTPKTSEPSTN
jgi:K+-sensing histidine kinase KdpD